MGGGIRVMLPKVNHRGPTYILPPKPEPGPLDPLGPLDEVDFLSGFRTPCDGLGPCGKHQGSAQRTRAPRDGSWPARRIRAPQDRSWLAGRIKAPAGRIRAPRDVPGPGSAERIRTPNVESGPAGRIRARGTDQSPAGRIRVPQDVPGLFKTNQDPAGRIRPPCDEPGLSSFQDEAGAPTPHTFFFVSECAPPRK